MRSRRVVAAGGALALAGIGVGVGVALAAAPAPASSSMTAYQVGTADEEDVEAGAMSSSGDSYLVGRTNGAFPGQQSAGSEDAFVTRVTKAGVVKWVRQFGTGSDDEVTAVAVSKSGDVYVAGETNGTFPGQPAAQGGDMFVARIGSTGTLKWVREIGTTETEDVEGIVVAPNGDVYVAGSTNGALAGQQALGGTDVTLLRYSSSGVLKFARQYGTAGDDTGEGIAVTKTGRVYVSGETDGTLPGATPSGDYDAMILAFDKDGQQVDSAQFGTDQSDSAPRIGVTTTGTVYVAGETEGAFPTFSPIGERDVFVAKLNSALDQQWLRQFGSDADDRAGAVAVTKTGNVVVVGTANGAFEGLVPGGRADGFVLSLSAAGTSLGHGFRQIGGGSYDELFGVGVSSSGAVIATGVTDGNLPGVRPRGGKDAVLVVIPVL